MLSNLLTIVFILGLLGCDSKEYKKKQNSNVGVVSELNQGDPQKVIDKLTDKKDLTPRERYYLASAYSQKGGVDVFSLYSVLEMQLFRKNALEWSDLAKDKNPYLKFMKSQDGMDLKKRLKKREKRWEKYLPKILIKYNIITEKPTQAGLKFPMSIEKYERVDAFLEKLYQESMKLPADIETRLNTFDNAVTEEMNAGGSFSWELSSYYYDRIRLETLKHNYLHPEDKPISGLTNVGWEMMYMNILWNTYESLPIMKQMPSLSTEQQEAISASLKEYSLLLDNKEFRKVALKNIVTLSGVSLISIYKGSFEIEEINSIQDLMCAFEPNVITDNYSLIRQRILFLAEVVKDSEEIKGLEKYNERMNELKATLPGELTEENRARYLEGIEKFKINSCFNG